MTTISIIQIIIITLLIRSKTHCIIIYKFDCNLQVIQFKSHYKHLISTGQQPSMLH
ncbi:unnamed protein product [Paramecium sonneborni]|uniref:Uncharacterized protein n=1 Tax=Paramecium sonneborni TaxID=65129 RepID=A0A8S1RK27_9CILI|nr:unnamed protein product [Paramecium sonneborni]